jgi:hypothetical protein
VTTAIVTIAPKWVELTEPDRHWRFDRSFLSSGWHCRYGDGCRGIHPSHDPARADGCCTLGAGITDAEDFLVVAQAVKLLDATNWQFASYGRRRNWWKRKQNGDIFTRVTNGGCIFLNRPDFAGGPGCALHAKAMLDGINPLHRKPNVCWQLPLRIDEDHAIDGIRRTTVRRWERGDFGDDGEPLSWWCTDPFADPTAATPLANAVVTTMEAELRALCGDDIYARLVAALARVGDGTGSSPSVSIR